VGEALKKYNLRLAYGEMFEVISNAGSKERAKTSFGNSIKHFWSYHEADKITDGIIQLMDLLVEYGAVKQTI
jgi:hypothetical protein